MFEKHRGPRKLYYCNTCYIMCAKTYKYMYINYYIVRLYIYIYIFTMSIVY